MFCGKCGTQNEDDAVFCIGCGARLDGGQGTADAGKPESPQTAAKLDHKKIGMIAVAIVAVLAIFLVIGLVGRKPYEKTAVRFFKEAADGDAKAMLKLLPPEMVDYMEDMYGDRKALIKSLESDDLEGMKVSVKCLDSEDVDSDDLADIKENYKDYLDIKVSDAKQVKLKITVKEDGETESDTIDIGVIKVGGSWYIDPLSGAFGGIRSLNF